MSVSPKTARFIRAVNWHSKGGARLYELSEPVEYGDGKTTSQVIVSAIDVSKDLFFDYMGIGPETYIFPYGGAEDDSPDDWSELPGSFRGALDHARALTGLGYDLEEEPA